MSNRLKKKNSPTSLSFSSDVVHLLQKELSELDLSEDVCNQFKGIIACPSNGKDQLLLLKKVLKELKQNEDVLQNTLKILCCFFVYCKSKHPLRRTLSSFLSGIPKEYDVIFHKVMNQLINETLHNSSKCHSSELIGTQDKEKCEMVASLMENFVKGDQVIQNNANTVLAFLCSSLKLFTQMARNNEGPVIQTQMIHNCLFTLKTIISVLQKCENPMLLQSLNENLVLQIAQAASEIVADESFLIECRNAAAMVFPAILLHFSRFIENLLVNLSSETFSPPGHTLVDFIISTVVEFIKNMKSMSCVVVTLHAILVKLPSYLLVSSKKCTVDLFSLSLQKICCDCTDKNTMILSFKTFCLWVTTIISKNIYVAVITDSAIPFLITNVDHGIDTVRHSVTASLKECLGYLLKSNKRSIVEELTQKYVTNDFKSRGKLNVLSSLCEISSMKSVLSTRSTFPKDLLELLGDVDLASHATNVYKTASKKHLEELQSRNESLSKWNKTWISGISVGLMSDCKDTKSNMVNYIVPAMLKVNPLVLNYLLSEFNVNSSMVEFYTAVVFLKTARGMKNVSQEIFKIKRSSSEGHIWNGLMNFDLLKKCIVHIDDQVRLDVLSLVCSSIKTTDHVSEDDIELIKVFLRYNMAVENPSFRQQSVVCFKKVFTRIFAHTYQITKSRSPNKTQIVQLYSDFIAWFIAHVFDNLYLDAPYCQMSTTLELISLITTFLGENISSDVTKSISIDDVIKQTYTTKLLKCLHDTYDPNRLLVLSIFSKKPFFIIEFSQEKLLSLGDTAIQNLYSPQPDISSVAAYQLCFLSFSENVGDTAKDRHPCLTMLKNLFQHLLKQVSIMKMSLLKASQDAPIHGTLFAIRLLFQTHQWNLNHSTVKSNREDFNQFVNEFTKLGFDIIELVSPYVTNEAPEGQLCNVNLSDIFELLSVHGGDTVLQAHVARMILVCCWRSMKEVSLILGLFISHFVDPSSQDSLLSNEMFLDMWDMFNNIMLRSKHAGAYELASIGFLKLCTTLWISRDESLRTLPLNAVQDLIADLTSSEPMENAQVTRRSAGLPFYLQSLCSTEPEINGKASFSFLMSSLSELCFEHLQTHDINKTVIALNVLRAFYKDAKMCEDVFPYVAKGIMIALNGFGSSLWPIRNSCTLLFSSLMQRIFGVKKVKMTGREFFSRYPQLYPYLVEKTKLMSVTNESNTQLHPSVFPILLLLSHLYPSTIEGADSLMKLDVFLESILSLSGNPVYKTRTMTANALVPLVSLERAESVTKRILGDIKRHHEGTINQNAIHGCLLQLFRLIKKWASLPLRQVNVVFLMKLVLKETVGLFNDSNVNPISKKCLLDIVILLLQTNTGLNDAESTSIIKEYVKTGVLLLISHKKKDINENTSAGYALLLRGVTAFIMELLKAELLASNLVKLFNAKDNTVNSVADIFLYMLRLRHADVVGEITAKKDDVKLSSFEGLADGLLHLLVQEVEPKDRAFPKILSLFTTSLSSTLVNGKQLLEIFKKCMTKPIERQREEEILSCLSLISLMLKYDDVGKDGSKERLNHIWSYVFQCSLPEQSDAVRYNMAGMLCLLAEHACLEPINHYQLYYCALNLLNDCDADIRRHAAQEIHKAYSSHVDDEKSTPQPRYILHHVLYENIYQSLKRNPSLGFLFLVGLQKNQNAMNWFQQRGVKDERTISSLLTNEVTSVYQPFVVFEQGKDNPYWDDQMILEYSIRILDRFINSIKHRPEWTEKDKNIVLEYIGENNNKGNDKLTILVNKIRDIF
ncbi:tRNA (32-2'-O)-methyltransferase regulator THADA-like isoform X2 [Clytia hemisphaerica]|uniref:tRNA (32-2'-O)-methyltransferase regulator THADA-like isoform X2 n=1 Tax=Clytia hemisphaerica TaxID=252671 RepID=UPI0034D63A32